MKQLLLLASLFLVTVSSQRTWNALRERFTPNPSDGFYRLPLSTRDTLIQNYVRVPENFGFPINVYCYPNDPRFCIMYNRDGNVVGVQISYLDQDVRNVTRYNYGTVGGFERTNIFGIPAYSFRAFFTNPEDLRRSGGRSQSQNIDELWVTLNGRLYSISRNEPNGQTAFYNQPSGRPFVRQGCFPGMGQHYFYNFDRNVSCSDLIPFFTLYEDGTLVGFGIADFGRGSVAPGGRDWYERPPTGPSSPVASILPRVPSCLASWGQEYGLYSVHVYFVDNAAQIRCP